MTYKVLDLLNFEDTSLADGFIRNVFSEYFKLNNINTDFNLSLLEPLTYTCDDFDSMFNYYKYIDPSDKLHCYCELVKYSDDGTVPGLGSDSFITAKYPVYQFLTNSPAADFSKFQRLRTFLGVEDEPFHGTVSKYPELYEITSELLLLAYCAPDCNILYAFTDWDSIPHEFYAYDDCIMNGLYDEFQSYDIIPDKYELVKHIQFVFHVRGHNITQYTGTQARIAYTKFLNKQL